MLKKGQLKKTVQNRRLYEALPDEDFLKSISFRCSYGKDMKGLQVSEEFIESVKTDIPWISEMIGDRLSELQMPYMIGYCGDLIDNPLRNPDADANTTVRGIITIHLTVWNYLDKYPDCYEVVDLRKGTSNDRGYRGVNLYYQLDGYHYPIEIQIYNKHDSICNSWIASCACAGESDEYLRGLREAYDAGVIINPEQYRRRVQDEKCE